MLLSVRVASVLSAEPRRVLLVRHGETDFNAAGMIQGTLESQLTESGRSQARQLGSYLAANYGGAIDRVLCSPKARTLATLDEIEAAFADSAPLPKRRVRPGLREIELTAWEGLYRADIERDQPEAWKTWKTAPASFSFSSGHAPLPHLWERIQTEWAHLRESTPPGTTTLIVAHGAFNRAFLAQIFGLPMTTFVDSDTGTRFGFPNCGCVEIEWHEPPGADGPTIRWRRRHPQSSDWSTQDEERAIAEREGEEPSACPLNSESTRQHTQDHTVSVNRNRRG